MNPFEQDENYWEYCGLEELFEFAFAAKSEPDAEPSPAPMKETEEAPSPPSIETSPDRRELVELTDDELDDEDRAKLWVPPTAAEILSQPLSKPKYILPGLVVEARNTVISVGKGVRSNVFAQILGYSLAGGIQFSPFGKPEPMPTLVAFGGSEWHMVQEQLSLIANQIENQDDRSRALSNLRVSHPHQRSVDAEELNCAWEQLYFRNSIPKGCKVVIFPDGETCLAPKRKLDYHSPFKNLLSYLNKMEIATVTFYRE